MECSLRDGSHSPDAPTLLHKIEVDRAVRDIPSDWGVFRYTWSGFLSNPFFPVFPLAAATLPASLRKIKASEKGSIPDTNTIVCTFLLDGVSL